MCIIFNAWRSTSEVNQIIHIIVQDQDGQNNNIVLTLSFHVIFSYLLVSSPPVLLYSLSLNIALLPSELRDHTNSAGFFCISSLIAGTCSIPIITVFSYYIPVYLAQYFPKISHFYCLHSIIFYGIQSSKFTSMSYWDIRENAFL